MASPPVEPGLEEAAYYQSIEEFFVSRRGDPLVLSNADWLLIRKWRKAGVPLRVAMRGIADALDGHAHSWGRKRKVGSLAYCAAEVEAARDRWQRALGFEAEARTSLSEALSGFAAALEGATALGPRGAASAAAVAAELRGWSRPASDEPLAVEDLTRRLAASERALLDGLAADVDPATRTAIRDGIEADLAPYRGRMPARVLDQIREESWSRRLLARHGIPRLSLFHL
jgi:hypothetical protein